MKQGRPLKSFYYSIIFISSFFIIGIFGMKNWKDGETRRFVKQLGPGINLGNTLDTHDLHYETMNPSDFETHWGNPITTKEMIEDISEAGFDVLRIPVTWDEHMSEDDIIYKDWLDRVQEIVDYGLEAGMYVIINAHHDEWYIPDDEHLPKARVRMRRLWSQIGERFESYNEKLLFESMNEPRLIGKAEEWTEGTQRSREIINELNEIFVQTVRESGGENSNRYLILPTYCARAEEIALKDFRMPEGDRLILSVHLYFPFHFALNMEGTTEFDPQKVMDTEELDKIFIDLERIFVKKGIPVIITEFSAVDKKNEDHRAAWARYVRQKAKKLGIACIWWDAGPGEEEGKPFPLYNRYTRKWLFPDLGKALIE